MLSRARVAALVIVLVPLASGSARGQADDDAAATEPATEPMIVLSESENEPGVVGEGEEIVEGYVESSHLLEGANYESEYDPLYSSWWNAEAPDPSMDSAVHDMMIHEDTIHFDDCSASDGDYSGMFYRDNWVQPDGVPNF